MLAAVGCLWWAGVARMLNWWGGGSFGPRMLSETMLLGAVLLIPVVEDLSLEGGRLPRLATAGFVMAGALAIGIHLRGAVAQLPSPGYRLP